MVSLLGAPQTVENPLGDDSELRAGQTFRIGDDDGLAGISALTDCHIKRNLTEKFGPQGFSRLLSAALSVGVEAFVRSWNLLVTQIFDDSDHRWFEDRGPPCTLLVFIDDATSTLMQLLFVPSESTASYFEALELYLRAHGRPVAFYSDNTAYSGYPNRTPEAVME